MYKIELLNDWDVTVASWFVDVSQEEVEQFVKKMNKEINNDYYIYYNKVTIDNQLPTKDIIKDIIKYTHEMDKEFTNGTTSDIGLTYENLKEWDITKVTDLTNLFK